MRSNLRHFQIPNTEEPWMNVNRLKIGYNTIRSIFNAHSFIHMLYLEIDCVHCHSHTLLFIVDQALTLRLRYDASKQKTVAICIRGNMLSKVNHV